MCSILERQHCRSAYKLTIVWSDDINTHERYWIRSAPRTTTLSDLIDVEALLNLFIVFDGVSKVGIHLDCDVLYLDVHAARTNATIF